MTKLIVVALFANMLSGLGEAGLRTTQPQKSAHDSSAKKRSHSVQTPNDQTLSFYSIDEILWWLPEDTETVSVVRGPYEPRAANWEPAKGIRAPELVDLILQQVPLAVFREARKGEFYNYLVGRTVLFSVQGSRDFRRPASLGQMLYEGCDVVILEHGLGATRAELIRQMSLKAKDVHRIGGHQCMLFEEKLERDTWQLLIAIPEPNVLLLATNERYLAQVLNRMHQKQQTRALPESLLEWKYVNTDAKFWALRHYDKAESHHDPSSPLSGNSAAASWIDPQAVGIVFDFDPGRSNLATVRYVSESINALKVFSDEQLKASQPGQDFKPLIRQKEPGVVEMLVSLDAKEQAGIFLFVLLALLGHAIYV